jgi:hypothetical protein
VAGELESRRKTTALTFGLSPWTCANASPAIGEGDIVAVDVDRLRTGILGPGTGCARFRQRGNTLQGCRVNSLPLADHAGFIEQANESASSVSTSGSRVFVFETLRTGSNNE